MATDRREDDFFETYTRGLTGEDIQRLFTRDARDAYRFFTRHIDEAAFAELPPLQRFALRARLLFLAFTLKLSPARRALFGVSLVAFVIGLLELFAGIGFVRVPVVPFILEIPLPTLVWADGTGWLVIGFVLVNLLGTPGGRGSPQPEERPGGGTRDPARDAAATDSRHPGPGSGRTHPAREHRRRRLLRHPAAAGRPAAADAGGCIGQGQPRGASHGPRHRDVADPRRGESAAGRPAGAAQPAGVRTDPRLAVHHHVRRRHRPGLVDADVHQRRPDAAPAPPARRDHRTARDRRHRPGHVRTAPPTRPRSSPSTPATCWWPTATASPRPRAPAGSRSRRPACGACSRRTTTTDSTTSARLSSPRWCRTRTPPVLADDVTVLAARRLPPLPDEA